MGRFVMTVCLGISTSLFAGCVTQGPTRYIGVNGSSGFNNISLQQAEAECDYQADATMRSELQSLRGGALSAIFVGSKAMEGCMRSKGFKEVR